MTQQTFTDAERRLTMAALMIVFLLSALDQTIVSTAMPRIISELNGLNLYSWVTTAYLLTSTVMVPIWGKLGDIFGRKPVLITGITIFLAGSWLSGIAGEFGTILGVPGMVQLIVFRALQGIGGGALFTTAFAIIADLYPPRERGKFAGIFGSVFGLASVLGRSSAAISPTTARCSWGLTRSPAGAGCSTSTCRSRCSPSSWSSSRCRRWSTAARARSTSWARPC
jgi:MFS family permease